MREPVYLAVPLFGRNPGSGYTPPMGKGKNRRSSGPARQNDLFVKYGLEAPSAMEENSFYSTLFRKACRTFLKPLDKSRTADSLRDSVAGLYAIYDEMLAEREEAASVPAFEIPPLACKSGCHYCCHMRIASSAPAILFAAHHLRAQDEARRSKLAAKMEAHEAKANTLSPLEQALNRELCPLNVEGLCEIYDGRPLLCRGFHSLRLDDCIKAFGGDDAAPNVTQDQHLRAIHGVLAEAIERCCLALNLNADLLEFIPALQIALSDSEAGDAYLRGENVFASAHRPDIIAAQNKHFAERLGSLRQA